MDFAAGPRYFHSLGIVLLRGRTFSDQDRAEAPPVAVVDESLVHAFFPDADPIGKRVAFEFEGARQNPKPVWREIVGVVKHIKYYGLTAESRRVQIYTPYFQLPLWLHDRRPAMALVVRTELEPEAVAADIRGQLRAMSPQLPVYDLRAMEQYVAREVEQPRLNMLLLSAFAVMSLALATTGIYGVLAYSVSQRVREFGIRSALGALPGDLIRLVVGEGVKWVLVGLGMGLAGAFVLTRLLSRLLYGVTATDPATFALVTLLGFNRLLCSGPPGYKNRSAGGAPF